MSRAPQSPKGRPTRRLQVLLVLSLLAGLLAMHGLGPGPLPSAPGAHAGPSGHAAASAAEGGHGHVEAAGSPAAQVAGTRTVRATDGRHTAADARPVTANSPHARGDSGHSDAADAGLRPTTGATDAAAQALVAGADCSHTEGGTGHPDHADAACAATGVGTAYAPPALVASLDAVSAPDGRPVPAPGSTEHGRAPPDLSELQLLRI